MTTQLVQVVVWLSKSQLWAMTGHDISSRTGKLSGLNSRDQRSYCDCHLPIDMESDMPARPLGAGCPECSEELTFQEPNLLGVIVQLRAAQHGCLVRCQSCGFRWLLNKSDFTRDIDDWLDGIDRT